MLRVVIVDDEPLARRALRRLLKPHAGVTVAGEADTVAAAAALVARERPDLVLLDIELGHGDGFDLLAALSPTPRVVFVTAHPQHAVEAFKVRAVDYLLKPITQERFDEALDRVRALVARQNEASQDTGTLELRTPSRTVIAAPGDLCAIRAEGDFCHVLLADQPALMILRSLSQFETQLPNPPFLRLDRSILINRDRLRRIDARTRDEVHLSFQGLADTLQVGRTAAIRLRDALAATR
ncbi:LytR/AlgR family response regulator transcription factor [Aquabacter sp. P-9]|uniref:LytR/AlgR family response regulator transcription factor n=1 Tax=Aquabacter sediminis TaxID=3029197 RepID=UPI00237E786E|nr:LytTR family DNA-binding domain-containing protein [Aquabacter sp. P-9]MDE1569447.1 LytTR family DNA-binding domain-containing protein [Aquabacter sp. P-9]